LVSGGPKKQKALPEAAKLPESPVRKTVDYIPRLGTDARSDFRPARDGPKPWPGWTRSDAIVELRSDQRSASPPPFLRTAYSIRLDEDMSALTR